MGISIDKPSSAPLAIMANALREWQRNHGGESDYAPTTMFIDKAEQPAQAVLDALTEAGYVVIPCSAVEDTLSSWYTTKASELDRQQRGREALALAAFMPSNDPSELVKD